MTFGVHNLPDYTAGNREEIIDMIRVYRQDSTADRIAYLYELAQDDPDEKYIELVSLQKFASFIIDNLELPKPQIGINSDGLLHVAWRIDNYGILAMDFLVSGHIRFAAILQSIDHKKMLWSKNGEALPDRVLNDVKPFIDELMGNRRRNS